MSRIHRRAQSRRAFGRSLAAALWLMAGPALADRGEPAQGHDDDHEAVWRARERGEIVSLEEILNRLSPSLPGRIIEIEFEIEHGVPVYEITSIDDQGRVMETRVDARDGAIIKQEAD